MAAYITVGATTTHGGTVITGSPHTMHNNVQVSRKGDKVLCKKCKKVTTILTGDPSFIVDGAPIARGGDITSCGAKLIAIQQSFAESDFEVFGVEQPEPMMEQPEPLVFLKSDPEALFASIMPNDAEPTQTGADGLPIQGSDDDLTKPVYNDNGVESAEEYRKRMQKLTENFDDGMSKTGNVIEDVYSIRKPTSIVATGKNAGKVISKKYGKEAKGALEEGGTDGLMEWAKEQGGKIVDGITSVIDWWDRPLNKNYPEKGKD